MFRKSFAFSFLNNKRNSWMWTSGAGAEKDHFRSWEWRVQSIHSVRATKKLQPSLNSLVFPGTSPFQGHLLLNVWHLSAKLRKHRISLSYIYSETLPGFLCGHGRKGFHEATEPYKQHDLKCTLALESFMVRTILCVLSCSTMAECQWLFYFELYKDSAHILECVFSHKQSDPKIPCPARH